MSSDSRSLDWLSLWTPLIGERKYLTQAERERFLAAVSALPNPKDQTFCEILLWTGCRTSEALATSAFGIDVGQGAILFCTLKKRGKRKGQSYRSIPVPVDFTYRLDEVHGICAAQREPDRGWSTQLWTMSRTTAWKRVKTVMRAAGICGKRACGRGLRHGYSVRARDAEVPEDRVQSWLGHDKLSTTKVYLDVSGLEDRVFAEKMWR